MTLQEAIYHCCELSRSCEISGSCADEHRQLKEWLSILLERTTWISVEDRLPEKETEVLILCRNSIITTAMYEDGTVLTEDSEWNWNEVYSYGIYSEEHDDWFVPEGWWEYKHFNHDDSYNEAVDIPVTHWMPLPPPPVTGGAK